MKDLRSDNEIINKIKKGENLSGNFQEISDRHSGIFYKMASKFISKKFKEKRLDFFKDKDYYIYQIILDFNENKKTKFSTYLGNRIKWMCINSYHKDLNCCEVNCPDQILYNCSDEKITTDYTSVFEAMECIKKEKDERIYKIFKLRYLEGKRNNVMPWKDICSSEGLELSVQGCINIHNKYLNKIRKEK